MRSRPSLVVLLALSASLRIPGADLRSTFADPPADARVMMRWWWFGPSVAKPQLEREMRAMKAGGIGGFEIQPVYPLQVDGNTPFLSDPFLDAVRFSATKGRELGMRVDLTLGSGWPFGGATVPLQEASTRLRTEKTTSGKLPKLHEGESVIAVYDAANRLVSSMPPAGEEAVVFIQGHTRQAVKRAAFGAEGYVMDHYSRVALDNYLTKVGEKLMTAFDSATRPHAIFCDSLEVYGNDWTPDLLEEFQRRRGYDLKPLLPALLRDIGPQTAGVRHDWGLTLTEMLHDRFLKPLHAWSKKHGTLLRMQNYGIPPAVMSSNALIDLPEGEGSQWKVVRASRWASSASHIYGKAATSSETWTWLHSPVFRATPLDMKAEADIHFLQGITQLIGHGWPYTPEGVEYPGWRFYAAGVFNDSNPWWIVMPDVTKYLQRVSWLLRQGRPANDVALYLPNADAWSGFTAGNVHMIEALREHVGPEVMPQIMDFGFGLDFFDDSALESKGRIEGRTLKLGENPYRVVVLPGVEFVPVPTMRQLELFAHSGGKVIATRRLPAKAPGLKATAAEHAEVEAISSRLFPKGPVPDTELGAYLRATLTPDFELSKPVPEIGFIHRTTGSEEIYFVANTGNRAQSVEARFRVPAGHKAEIWDPFTGSAVQASADRLELEPYGSRVIVFSAKPGAPVVGAVAKGSPKVVPLSGWTVAFGTAAPKPVKVPWSWTDDEATRYFSGVATYRAAFDVAAGADSVVVDFGEAKPLPIPAEGATKAGPGMRAWLTPPIGEAAVVYVNGTRAGSVWCPPWRLDVTAQVKPGRNEIRLEVANTAVNYMARHPLPDYTALTAKYGSRFDPQDMDKITPLPSGLLGPVVLRIR